ncbi:hypothetical protein GGR51DRAFT_568443 [Nemania sp. FL0031]|nr:hypothetical protein GGR51DRAFT_568443 [Nemania sp. FL0031]
MSINPQLNPRHDCNIHHRRFPAQGSPEIPQPYSYDPHQLLVPLPDYRVGNPRTILSPERAALARYEFLADYMLLNEKTATPEEWTTWIEGIYLHLDRYFFKGALSQYDNKLMRISVINRQDHGRWALYRFYDQSLGRKGQITVYLVNNLTGDRVRKLGVLNSIAHEMCHAYLDLFYNWCPDDDWQQVLANNTHGVLWQEVHKRVFKHMETWHPSFANLTDCLLDTPISDIFYQGYHQWVEENFTYYEYVWKHWPNNAVSKALGVFPKGAKMLPERVKEFASSLIKLRFSDYSAFVKHKAPIPGTLYIYYVAYKVFIAHIIGVYVAAAIFIAGRYAWKICWALFAFLQYFWAFWSEVSDKQAHANITAQGNDPSILRVAGRPPWIAR